jgi:response regulator RpfG family c-di-GMP phosphodiesterase
MIEDVEKKKILYVDDEIVNLELFMFSFEDDYEVITAISAKQGLEVLNKIDIKVVLSDLKMPEINGLEFIEKVKQQSPDKICMLLTAYAEPDVLIKAINSEMIYRYMIKPWDRYELKKVIESAFERLTKAVN